jgi:hypothetical protein
MARKYTRKKITKVAKLKKYFKEHPTATAREAADAVGASYNTAWKARKRTSANFDTSAHTYRYVVDDSGTARLELSHPPTPKYANDSRQDLINELPQTLVQDDKHESIVSDGSTASYYELPAEAKELQDLISYKNMNAQIGEIFRAAYRYGQSSHSDMLRDARKIKFYIDAEIKRLGG